MGDRNIQVLDEQINREIEEENEMDIKNEKNNESLVKLPGLNNDDKAIYLKLWNNSRRDEEEAHEDNGIMKCMEFLKEFHLINDHTLIQATGGGAHKNFELLKNELGVDIIKNDEMRSLVKGMVFLQDNIKNACFTFTEDSGKKFQEEESEIYPRILVSIGSGVSIIKVNSNDSYERVGGTMIGGGTLMGLSNLFFQVNDFK